MSGSPNIPQIRQLRDLLSEIASEQEALSTAEHIRDQQTQIASNARARLQKLDEGVLKLMESMDCGPNGNYGSGNRMLALLTGLLVEVRTDARSKP